MKRLFLLASLTVVSAFAFMGVAGAGVASAASCQVVYETPTNSGNDLSYTNHLGGCVNVDNVEFIQEEWTKGGVFGRFQYYDTYGYHSFDNTTYYSFVSLNCHYFMFSGEGQFVQAAFDFRIHNPSTGTWGPFHWTGLSYGHWMVCQ